MNSVIRINSILHIRNFDFAFKGAFVPGWNGSKISREALSENVFSDFRASKSESECELLSGSNFEIDNLRKEIKEGVKDFFLFSGKDVFVRMDLYKEWKSLSLLNGQDVFIASVLDKHSNYDWPFAIQAKSSALDAALSTGYAENHCHFNAAGPSFLINWTLLHNGAPFDAPMKLLNNRQKEFESYYSSEKYVEFKNVVWLSIYLRRYLFYLCKDRKKTISVACPKNLPKISFSDFKKPQLCFVSEIQSAIEKLPCGCPTGTAFSFSDYACDGSAAEPLYGERVLLHRCFQNYESWTFSQKMHFFLYLLCRKYVLGFFCQNNLWFGFHNFKRFERMGDLFIPEDPSMRYETSRNIYKVLLESPELSKLEIRLAPKTTYKATRKRIAESDPYTIASGIPGIKSSMPVRYADVKYGVVLHFIKKTRPLSGNLTPYGLAQEPRCFEKMKEYEKQCDLIKTYALMDSSKRFPLVGVDAANEEIRCRPELFAPFYRELRYFKGFNYRGEHVHSDLRFTFHCGEDFVTLADGIRAVYEAVTFLDLRDGDRIGHASALGVDVDRYFALKGRVVTQTKQDLLDDLCFLYLANAEFENSYEAEGYLKGKIKQLLSEIYENDNVDSYLLSLLLRKDHPTAHRTQKKAGDYKKTSEQMLCEGHASYLADIEEPRYAFAWRDEQALRFIHEYHYSHKVRQEGDSISEIIADAKYKFAVKTAQKHVVKMLISKNIGVETNPTSNYLIGPVSDFEDIPALKMMGLFPGSEHYRDLRISVGTDDPGMFYTSLRNEYTSLYYALYSSGLLEGASLISEIKDLAQSSLDLSFLRK